MTPVFYTPFALSDGPQVQRLLHQSFGPQRLSLPSYTLRQGPPLDRLSWVARSPEGHVLGCLRFWQVGLSASPLKSVLLGPLAVDLALRGMGVARGLTQFGLNRVADLGFDLCFVVGEPRLYRRHGFTNAAWSEIQSGIPPRRLQVRELRLGALSQMDTPQTLIPYGKG